MLIIKCISTYCHYRHTLMLVEGWWNFIQPSTSIIRSHLAVWSGQCRDQPVTDMSPQYLPVTAICADELVSDTI